MHVGCGARSHSQHRRGAACSQRQHARIIGVKQGEAVRRQGAQQCAFFLRNGVERAKHVEVTLVDGGDQADAGAHHLRQELDLAEFIRGQLQHGQPLPGLHAAQGNRQAEAAVEAAGIAKDRTVGRVGVAAGQRGGNQFFGRRFAARTGDGNHFQRMLAADGAGVGQEGLARVRHDNARDGQRGGRRLFAQDAGRAALPRLLDEIMAVAGFGLDRHKERPWIG